MGRGKCFESVGHRFTSVGANVFHIRRLFSVHTIFGVDNVYAKDSPPVPLQRNRQKARRCTEQSRVNSLEKSGTAFRNVMEYIRLFADDGGESHFEHVEIEFADREYTSSAPPLGLSSMTPAAEFGFMKVPAGWESDWHTSAARNFFAVVSGEWSVTASDGETRQFGPQSLLLVEDTTGKGHKSRVVSDSIVAIIELSGPTIAMKSVPPA